MMTCLQDKFDNMCKLLKTWISSGPSLSLKAIRSAVGLLYFISAGFTIGRADVAALIMMRTQGETLQARSRQRAEATLIKVSAAARASLQFWYDFFPSWGRTCPVVGQFSPVASAETIGFVDASTTDGFGGTFLDETSGTFLAFSRPMTEGERSSSLRATRESTAFLELIAIYEWLQHFAPLCAAKRTLLLTDNATALNAVDHSYSQDDRLAPLVLHIRRLLSTHHILLRTRYILTDLNVVADALSHLQVNKAQCHALLLVGRRFVLLSSPPTLPPATRC